MFTNAISLTDAGISNASRAFIAACDDLDLLVEALALETAREGGARKTRVGQLTLRIETLRAATPAGEAAAEITEVVTAEVTVTEEAAVEEAAEATIEEPAVLVAAPVEIIEAAPVVVNPAANTAVALLKGIDSGNVALVAALLTGIRQSGNAAFDESLAAALVDARKATPSAAPKRARAAASEAPKAARSTVADKLAAVIALADKDDAGVVTIKGAHLTAAEAPTSWGSFSGSWYSTLLAPVKALGYTAKVKRVEGAQQIVLTPIAAE